MKNAVTILGAGLLGFGLVALFVGVTAMATIGNCLNGDCPASNGDAIVFFPIGLTCVILGGIFWSAGAGAIQGSGRTRNPLAAIGYLGIFGLTFFGVGAVMWLADRQPGADHTTNVLSILGLTFGLVGLITIGVDVWLQLAGRRNARVLATGIRGTATVTGVRDTNVTVNMNPMVALDLRIEIPGQPVAIRTVRQVISRLQVGEFRPGVVLVAVADRADPTKVVIDWDRSPVAGAADEALGQQASPLDVATILREAADQIAAGHANPASPTMDRTQLAAILRRASAAAAGAANAAGLGPGASGGRPAATPAAQESSMPSMPAMPLISSPAAPPPAPDDPAAGPHPPDQRMR